MDANDLANEFLLVSREMKMSMVKSGSGIDMATLIDFDHLVSSVVAKLQSGEVSPEKLVATMYCLTGLQNIHSQRKPL